MPRIRAIKPQFWIDEGLAEVCREARLLYIGLWNLCDDRGVFEYRAAKIRVQLFPYDADITNGKMDEWLQELNISGHIIYFQENSKDYGYIPTFLKHQEIKKPSKWTFTTNLPDTITAPPVAHQLPTATLPVTQQCLKVKGKRYKEEVKGISKEEDIYIPLFNYWNQLEIITHKKLTTDMKRAIDSAKVDYSEEDLKQAFSNYAEIVKGVEYYFKHKWTLVDFLSRGKGNNIERFLDLEIAKTNFRKESSYGAHQSKPGKIPTRYTRPEELLQ